VWPLGSAGIAWGRVPERHPYCTFSFWVEMAQVMHESRFFDLRVLECLLVLATIFLEPLREENPVLNIPLSPVVRAESTNSIQ
jgi:hypothetical protein